MSDITCMTCLFWTRYPDEVSYEDGTPEKPGAERNRYHPLRGDCRKLPPLAEYDCNGDRSSIFPTTHENEWCGDHALPPDHGSCKDCESCKDREWAHEYRGPYMQCRRARPVGYGYRREDGDWKQAWGWPTVKPYDRCGEWERATP